MNALLLSTDLMLASSAHGIAARHGVTVMPASSSADALQACAASAIAMMIIDLRLPNLDVLSFVQQARAASAQPIAIVACGPHVHTQSLAAAHQAGCDVVITRGDFDRRIEAMFAEFKPAEERRA